MGATTLAPGSPDENEGCRRECPAITVELCQMFAQGTYFRTGKYAVRLLAFTATYKDPAARAKHTDWRQPHVFPLQRNHHRHGLLDDRAIKKILFNRHVSRLEFLPPYTITNGNLSILCPAYPIPRAFQHQGFPILVGAFPADAAPPVHSGGNTDRVPGNFHRFISPPLTLACTCIYI